MGEWAKTQRADGKGIVVPYNTLVLSVASMAHVVSGMTTAIDVLLLA